VTAGARGHPGLRLTRRSDDPCRAALDRSVSVDGMDVCATAPVSRSDPPTRLTAMANATGRNEGTPNRGVRHLQRKRTARSPRCLGTAGLYQTCIIHAQPLSMLDIASLLH
jgi:hypothetical protein